MSDCFVYVFARCSEAGMTSPVKIGISTDVDKRLAGIQTACPFKIDLAYLFECPDRESAKALERCFHETQREHRSHGEWFTIEPVEAIHLLCLALRSMLLHYFKLEPDVIEASLEKSGVIWAEKRFNLTLPSVLQ